MRNDMKIELIKPQINADERRLIVFDFKTLFEVYSEREIVHALSGQLKHINSLQRTAMWHGEVQRQGHKTRITQIGRIFTDNPCKSASSLQSAFHCTPSGFVSVHPRLIFYREMRVRGELAG
jgi:hypothetical protein